MLVFLEGASTADNVITVKLNSDPLVPSVGQDVTVMGWGDTDIHILNVELSAVLMNFDTSVISNQECDAIERISGLITDNMLCARANGIHCNGDSGGPMIIKGDDSATDVQVGVVSWGNYCQSHAVYDRVSQAYDWIQSEVCRESNYATEAGFHCSSISTNPPISSPTNPPVVSSISTNPPISSPADPTVVSPSNDGIFIDTVVWNDIYGDGCDWYEANGYPGCPRYGSGDYGGIGVADDNCWWCVMG
jgi:trypsin